MSREIKDLLKNSNSGLIQRNLPQTETINFSCDNLIVENVFT